MKVVLAHSLFVRHITVEYAPKRLRDGSMPRLSAVGIPGIHAGEDVKLKMDAEEKAVVSRAAALVGTTMAAFVRTAAKEKARERLDRESRITMSAQDFQAFTMALNGTFTPNVALQNALSVARKVR
jgi:uncharacterized protein (DUF1778 family)